MPQKFVLLRHREVENIDRIDTYIEDGGYEGLKKALQMDKGDLIDLMKEHELHEVDLKQDKQHIRLACGGQVVQGAPMMAPVPQAAPAPAAAASGGDPLVRFLPPLALPSAKRRRFWTVSDSRLSVFVMSSSLALFLSCRVFFRNGAR